MDLDTVFVSLLLTAVFSSSAPRQYEFVQMKMNCTDAQRYCRENYTDLASIDNSADVTELLKRVNESADYAVWIGLMETLRSEWRWSLGDPVLYTAHDSLYRNWASNQTTNGVNYCAYMSRDGLWSNDSCNSQRFFVCYSDSSKGFILVQQLLNWRNAQSFCRANHTDLSSVRNSSENQQIQQLMNTSGVTAVWIGLFRDSWEWSDKSNSSFRYWAYTEPHGNEGATVLVMSGGRRGQWEDWPCYSKFTFVCHEDQFILIKQNLSWSEAMVYCRQNYVDLVSVPSPQIEQRVMSAARRASTAAVWMGLHHYCSMNMWLWLRGEVVCYQNWAAGNGTGPQDCSEQRVGAIRSSGDQRWVSLPATLRLNFICTNSEP
ncbi:C-type mannose receptor 2-like [Carassius auratus]|uniref:C-type mannose receptor 2-like n=1 Tax=Carassius auratus TaxID=7957 RepID=A0A6P6KVY2_CARAU|nr:C-type mannose receptor 2-like [Carassius auratus]